MTLTVRITSGDNIYDTVIDTIRLAKQLSLMVEFEFNRVIVTVGPDSTASKVFRQFDDRNSNTRYITQLD